MTRRVRMTVDEGLLHAISVGVLPSASIPLFSAEDVHIKPFDRVLVATGMSVALPSRCGGFVVPEPGFAMRTGITFANSPGLIDGGYRGEVGLIAVNLDAVVPVDIKRGEHIANMHVLETALCEVAVEGGGADMPAGPTLHVKVLDEVVVVPAYAHESDNGIDLRCAESFTLAPFERKQVRLGLALELSPGLMAQVQPRSGLALKQGLSVVGSPHILSNPTLDDELAVPFVNLDPERPIEVDAGTRVAQLVVFGAARVEISIVQSLDETDRGEGGFGSTGM